MGRPAGLVLFALALLSSRTSTAEEPVTRANELYREARVAYEAHQLERALALLGDAYALQPKPLYAYNIATVLESAGRYAEAHAQVQRALAAPDLDPDLARLARERSRRLEPLLEVAVLSVDEAPQDAIVRVDGEPLEPGQERQLEPGTHELCGTRSAAGETWCRHIELSPGRRHDVPFAAPAAGSGMLRWHPTPGVVAIAIGACELEETTAVAHRFHLDAGPWRLGARDASGASAWLEASVPPGAELAWRVTPSEPPPSPALNVAAWVTTAVGAATLVAGVLLWADADADRARVEDAPVGGGGVRPGLTEREAEAIWNRSVEQRGWGIAATAGGGALAAAGASWLLWQWLGADDAAVPTHALVPLAAFAAPPEPP